MLLQVNGLDQEEAFENLVECAWE